MSSFLIYYNKKLNELSENKNKSLIDYIKFLIYFSNYYSQKNIVFLLGIFIILYFFPGKIIKGNDGSRWESRRTNNGTYRWVKATSKKKKTYIYK